VELYDGAVDAVAAVEVVLAELELPLEVGLLQVRRPVN